MLKLVYCWKKFVYYQSELLFELKKIVIPEIKRRTSERNMVPFAPLALNVPVSGDRGLEATNNIYEWEHTKS